MTKKEWNEFKKSDEYIKVNSLEKQCSTTMNGLMGFLFESWKKKKEAQNDR